MTLFANVKLLDDALDQWVEWAWRDESISVAGFPKRSLLESMAMSCLPGRGRTGMATDEWIRSNPKQTRVQRAKPMEDRPIPQAVELGLIELRQYRPDLYHVLVADQIALIPQFRTGWDQRALADPWRYVHLPRRQEETETDHKLRLARRLGLAKTRFYDLRNDAKLCLGVWLNISIRYDLAANA